MVDTLMASTPPVLDLSVLPPVFLLSAHLESDRRHELEEALVFYGAPLTYDIEEARIVVGNVGTKRRAEMELRILRLWTEEVSIGKDAPKHELENKGNESRGPSKRAKLDTNASSPKSEVIVLDASSTESEPDMERHRTSHHLKSKTSPKVGESEILQQRQFQLPRTSKQNTGAVFVVKLAWLEKSIEQNKALPLEEYLIYAAIPKTRPTNVISPEFAQAPIQTATSQAPKSRVANAEKSADHSPIIERAQHDAPVSRFKQPRNPASMAGRRRFGDQHHSSPKEKAKLLQQTTSDYDSAGEEIPPAPDWVKREIKYACMRSTPSDQANSEFIDELKKIRRTRELRGDEIGVRAYSTSIAAVAAYPYLVGHPQEILQLPGCDVKIANLWIEWKNTGVIKEAQEGENDEAMKVLRDFYEIWGVGATTAREFYYDKGWRDRDDIVEYGWDTLTRVQQIGLKYYDEFLLGIPRAEVESIAAVVKEHAIRVRDTGIEVLVVGGYRRGKKESGDVDIVVSHRQLEKTANLVTDIVASLETEEWITHTLLLSLTGTHRGQATLPFKGQGAAGHGFDTLDKALVVWQDPNWPGMPKLSKSSSKASSRSSSATREQEEAQRRQRKKNPNPHRRVDIIISPWRTVGCAVTGWSGGTTFQRDLRRYSKYRRQWKFDSSGVRDRRSGLAVELEGPEGVGSGFGMVDAEKQVFEGLGLRYIPPEERCTG